MKLREIVKPHTPAENLSDDLTDLYRSLPENYVNYTKAGKMLKEMIQYFSET